MASTKKKNSSKGVAKTRPDNDNPELNPLLHVENKHGFSMDTDNLLESPDALIYNGYENFEITTDLNTHQKTVTLDSGRLQDDTEIVVILRYYEYLCTAKMRFWYIMPMLQSGMLARDVFAMVEHSLKNKLLINVPSFETVFEPDIKYLYKVKYE